MRVSGKILAYLEMSRVCTYLDASVYRVIRGPPSNCQEEGGGKDLPVVCQEEHRGADMLVVAEEVFTVVVSWRREV